MKESLTIRSISFVLRLLVNRYLNATQKKKKLRDLNATLIVSKATLASYSPIRHQLNIDTIDTKTGTKRSISVCCFFNAIAKVKIEIISVNRPRDIRDRRLKPPLESASKVAIRSKVGFKMKNNINDRVSIFKALSLSRGISWWGIKDMLFLLGVKMAGIR